MANKNSWRGAGIASNLSSPPLPPSLQDKMLGLDRDALLATLHGETFFFSFPPSFLVVNEEEVLAPWKFTSVSSLSFFFFDCGGDKRKRPRKGPHSPFLPSFFSPFSVAL